MRNTVPTMYTAVPTGVTNVIGHVRRNHRSRCRNPAGHLRRHSGHVPGITGHVGPEYSLIANSPLAPLADWGEVHEFLGDAIMWIAGLHAAAAIFHHVVLKDRVLSSMLPQVERRRP